MRALLALCASTLACPAVNLTRQFAPDATMGSARLTIAPGANMREAQLTFCANHTLSSTACQSLGQSLLARHVRSVITLDAPAPYAINIDFTDRSVCPFPFLLALTLRKAFLSCASPRLRATRAASRAPSSR